MSFGQSPDEGSACSKRSGLGRVSKEPCGLRNWWEELTQAEEAGAASIATKAKEGGTGRVVLVAMAVTVTMTVTMAVAEAEDLRDAAGGAATVTGARTGSRARAVLLVMVTGARSRAMAAVVTARDDGEAVGAGECVEETHGEDLVGGLGRMR